MSPAFPSSSSEDEDEDDPRNLDRLRAWCAAVGIHIDPRLALVVRPRRLPPPSSHGDHEHDHDDGGVEGVGGGGGMCVLARVDIECNASGECSSLTKKQSFTRFVTSPEEEEGDARRVIPFPYIVFSVSSLSVVPDASLQLLAPPFVSFSSLTD
ncbi:hypothetical protein EW146_g10291 [Bondarzewia mesenterica]|uniref:Uncharacterized protein n=1 Tax=Bondarzewia mesenterica TaxID=1095465 RepID=A0A4S4KYM6_9AGAM|nr:hypothetical protein EW146_g10291 [Bondarzewia mesenterica]